jgi:hypothetical protein
VRAIIYNDEKGRLYWIDENHPETASGDVVCRVVEGNVLRHTSLQRRSDLRPYLLTDMSNGVVNMGLLDNNADALIDAGYALLTQITSTESELAILEPRLSATYRKNIKAARDALHSAARKLLDELLKNSTANRLNARVESDNTKA